PTLRDARWCGREELATSSSFLTPGLLVPGALFERFTRKYTGSFPRLVTIRGYRRGALPEHDRERGTRHPHRLAAHDIGARADARAPIVAAVPANLGRALRENATQGHRRQPALRVVERHPHGARGRDREPHAAASARAPQPLDSQLGAAGDRDRHRRDA